MGGSVWTVSNLQTFQYFAEILRSISLNLQISEPKSILSKPSVLLKNLHKYHVAQGHDLIVGPPSRVSARIPKDTDAYLRLDFDAMHHYCLVNISVKRSRMWRLVTNILGYAEWRLVPFSKDSMMLSPGDFAQETSSRRLLPGFRSGQAVTKCT